MGWIEQRSDTTFRLNVSNGRNKTPERKIVELPEGLTEKQKEKELNKQMVLFEKSVEEGTYLDGEKTTFKEFAENWLENYAEIHLKKGTINYYKRRLNTRIIPAIGHLKLSKIQPHHLMKFYKSLAEEGARLDLYYQPNTMLLKKLSQEDTKFHIRTAISLKTGLSLRKGGRCKIGTAEKVSKYYGCKIGDVFDISNKNEGKTTLSKKEVKSYHDVISAVLSTAVQWNILLNDPSERVRAPRKEKKVPQYYDDIRVAELLSKLIDAPLKYCSCIFLTIDTGVRISELAGLSWADVDFESNSIFIGQQRQYVQNYGIVIDDPKTYSGVRKITVSPTVMNMLKKYKKEQAKNKLKLGNMYHENDFIFVHENGKAMYPRRPYQWFREFLTKNDMPKISFHALRHTNASILISKGEDISTLSERLGHAEKGVTLNVYTHLIRSKEQKAANKMEDFYSEFLK